MLAKEISNSRFTVIVLLSTCIAAIVAVDVLRDTLLLCFHTHTHTHSVSPISLLGGQFVNRLVLPPCPTT